MALAKRITKKRTLDYRFGDKHIDYMRRSQTCQINVAEGAVRAGKTVDNVFAFAQELESTPDKIHLASGSTMGNAKLNIGDGNGYGLEGIFRGRCRWGKYKGNEALLINTPSGRKVVIFAGAEMANAYKKIRGNSYGMWIATEINLHHASFIVEAFNRQLAAKHIKVFWDLNPSNPKHEIYTKYVDDYAQKQKDGVFPSGFNYEHFTIFDNATLPPSRIDEIISRYDKDSIWYIRDILGQRSVAEGLIYQRLAAAFVAKTETFRMSKAKAKDLVIRKGAQSIICGIDFGGNGSGHSFVATAILRGYTGIVALRSERYLEGKLDPITGRKLGNIDPDMLADLFIRFYEQIIKDYGMVTWIYADSAETVLINGLRAAMRKRRYGNVQVGLAAKRRINDRIFTVTSLAAEGKLWVTEDCATLEEAISSAVWDPQKIELERLDNGTTDIDTLDAFEYTFERFIPQLTGRRG